MSIIIYGDLHGCLKKFKELRSKVNPSENDKEILVGDFLDRGNESNELLSYIVENKIVSILGNHEYKYIRYKRHNDLFLKTGKKNPMHLDEAELVIFNKITDDEFKYLESLKFFIKIDKLTIIHAGITNKINLDTATIKELEKTLWIGTLDKNQKTLSLNSKNEEAKFWTEYYDGKQGIIVYGHRHFKEVKFDQYSIGIDTGCVYGNKLSACIISNTKNPMQDYTIVDVKSNYGEINEY